MYKTVLVKELIEDGAKLSKGWIRIGFPIQAAVWFYDPEKMSWKLVIVSNVAGIRGHLRRSCEFS